MALTSAQQAQLAGAKKQLLSLQSQLKAKQDAQFEANKKNVGGGSSRTLFDMSVALAQGKALPQGVVQDQFDSKGRRTGKTKDVSGQVVSSRSSSLSSGVSADLASEDAIQSEIQKLSGGLKDSGVAGGGSSVEPTATVGASVNTMTDPTGEAATRFGINTDAFNKLLDPAGTFSQFKTAHSTPMFAPGIGPGSGFGAGGGGGGSWGGGGGAVSSGPVQGPVQSAPAPTNKAQANSAGIQDTGGASAATGQSSLADSLSKLMKALSTFDVNSITGTADGVDNAVNNVDNALKTSLESALADLPDYEKQQQNAKDLYEMKMDIIDDRRDALEERYKEDKDAIEGDFASQEADKKTAQAKESGRLAGGLAASGAYLGFDNVNHAAMLSLEVTHSRELTVLGQGKIAAINAARRAFEDSDFALLTEQVNAIDAYDKKITDLTNTHFEQTLKVTQEARANVKFMQDTEAFERNKGFDNLDTIIEAGTMPTEKDIQKYAQTFNLSPEDVRGFINAKIASKELQKTRDATSDDLALVNVLKGIDKGTYVTIGGKRYEGLNKPAAGAAPSEASGLRRLTYKDAFDKFGNSPVARELVAMGATVNDAYELFGSDQIPDDIRESYKASIDKLSNDPAIAEQQLQDSWDRTSREALGFSLRADLGNMKAGSLDSAINEINQGIIDQYGETAGRVMLINQQDVDENPILYPVEVLNLKAAQWAKRNKEDASLDVSSFFPSGSTQTTLQP